MYRRPSCDVDESSAFPEQVSKMSELPNKHKKLMQEIQKSQTCSSLNILNAFHGFQLASFSKELSDYNMAQLQVIQLERQEVEKNKTELKKSKQKMFKLKQDV